MGHYSGYLERIIFRLIISHNYTANFRDNVDDDDSRVADVTDLRAKSRRLPFGARW